VEGNKVSFVENLTYQDMPLRIDFTRDVGGAATQMLTPKRSK
jgi:hypothetical protein